MEKQIESLKKRLLREAAEEKARQEAERKRMSILLEAFRS